MAKFDMKRKNKKKQKDGQMMKKIPRDSPSGRMARFRLADVSDAVRC